MNSENRENVDWKKESEFWKRSFLELSKSNSVNVPRENGVKSLEQSSNSAQKVAHNGKKRKAPHKKQIKLSIFKKGTSDQTAGTIPESSQGDKKIKKPKLDTSLNTPKHNNSRTEEKTQKIRKFGKIQNNAKKLGKIKKNAKKSGRIQNNVKKLGGVQNNTKKLSRKQNKLKKLAAYLKVAVSNEIDKKKAMEKILNDSSVQNNPLKTECVETTAPLVEIDTSNLKEIRAQLTKRRNELLNQPHLNLSVEGSKSSLKLDTELDNPDALFVVDLQTLILRIVGGDAVPNNPLWCQLSHVTRIHNVTVLLINGISTKEYKKRIEIMPNMKSIFDNVVEIIPPSKYGSGIEEELVWVNLSSRFRKAFCRNQRLVEAGIEKGFLSPLITSRTMFNIIKSTQGDPKKKVVYVSPDGKCTKLSLLLNLQQMFREQFPFPGDKSKLGRVFVPTKDVYDRVSEDSPMFGLDCEMCFTTNRQNELTRVSIVNEKMELIYDKLVKPKAPITDYLTQYSGITKEMLKNVTYSIKDVQRDIRDLLPGDAILVGQSLTSDMNALELSHPYIIDTSIIYNLSGRGATKTGLKKLSEIFLNEKIQCHGAQGHDSFEDSATALKLVLLKLGKGVKFGDVRWNKAEDEKIKRVEIIENDKVESEKIKKQLENIEPQTSDLSINLLKYIELAKKKVAVVDHFDLDTFNKAFRAFNNSVIYHDKRDTNLEICSALENVINRYDLNIGQFSVAETKKKNSIKELDDIVKRVYDALPKNGVLMVITSKSADKEGEINNGLCFLKLKNLDATKIQKFD